MSEYANAVIDLLTADFPDLRDPVTADIVRERVTAHAANPGGFLEVIIDDPYSARWRLVAAPGKAQRGRVRLTCRKPYPTQDDWDRELRLNEALQALGQETQR